MNNIILIFQKIAKFDKIVENEKFFFKDPIDKVLITN